MCSGAGEEEEEEEEEEGRGESWVQSNGKCYASHATHKNTHNGSVSVSTVNKVKWQYGSGETTSDGAVMRARYKRSPDFSQVN